MNKTITALCAGITVISSIVPVGAASASVTTSSLTSQELSQVKALQAEIQNLTTDSSWSTSASAKVSALSVTQGSSTSYAQKLKDNVNKVGETKVKQLIKKYVVNQNTKPTITDKSFLKLSKDEQVAVISYLLPSSINSTYTVGSTNFKNINPNSSKTNSLSVQASGISDSQLCMTVSGGFNVYNTIGKVTAKLNDRYVWCFKPAKYIITSGSVINSYPQKYTYTGAAQWLGNVKNPSCSYSSPTGGMSTMNCSGIYDLFTGFQLWDNYIGVHIYYESGFNLDGGGGGTGYAVRK